MVQTAAASVGKGFLIYLEGSSPGSYLCLIYVRPSLLSWARASFGNRSRKSVAKNLPDKLIAKDDDVGISVFLKD